MLYGCVFLCTLGIYVVWMCVCVNDVYRLYGCVFVCTLGI